MRICFYFGTFNPPHLGHAALIKSAFETKLFDKMIVVPAYKSPFKPEVENPFHGLNMVRDFVKHFENTECSDIEFKRDAPSYTSVTLKEFQKNGKFTEPPFFIIGEDAFFDIEKWYNSEELKILRFLVFPRNDKIGAAQSEEKKIKFLNLAKKGYNYTSVNFTPVNVSSSEIRERIKNGQNCEEFLYPETLRYVNENNLYKR